MICRPKRNNLRKSYRHWRTFINDIIDRSLIADFGEHHDRHDTTLDDGRPGREHLRLTVDAIPQPGPHEIRVKVKAVALNYRDKLMIESGMGLTLPQPFTPPRTWPARSTLSAPASAASNPALGSSLPSAPVGSTAGKTVRQCARVPYHTLGGFYQGVLAEYVILHEDWLVAAPASLDDVQASTLPCAGLTARSRWWSKANCMPARRCWCKAPAGGAVRAADRQSARRRGVCDLRQR